MKQPVVRPLLHAYAPPLASAAFFVGLFFNNVTFIVDSYLEIVLFATCAFTATCVLTAARFAYQKLAVRAWLSFISLVSVLQLFDCVGRRLIHIL